MKEVVAELQALNKKADEIIGILKTPESKVMKAMDILGRIIAIAGAITIIEVVRGWILGG